MYTSIQELTYCWVFFIPSADETLTYSCFFPFPVQMKPSLTAVFSHSQFRWNTHLQLFFPIPSADETLTYSCFFPFPVQMKHSLIAIFPIPSADETLIYCCFFPFLVQMK